MTEVWKRIQRHRTETQARAHAEAEKDWRDFEVLHAVLGMPEPMVHLFEIPLAVARELAAMGER